MTFPVVQTRSSGFENANSSTHPVTLPSGITAGDVLLVVFSIDSTQTCSTTSTGWTKLGQASNSTTASGAIFYKTASGSDSLTIDTSGTEQGSYIALRISGASGVVTGTSSNGSSTNSNPPSHTPAAGAKDYLWVVTRSGDDVVVATAAPTNYSNLQTQAGSSFGGSSNTAERTLNAATEDPGTFTSATEQWVCWTIAVEPAAGGQPISITQTTETDTANAVTAVKSRGVGQVAETDTANAVSSAKSLGIAQAVETDTAGSITPAKSRPIGQATETDTANNIGGIPVLRVDETNTANSLAPAKGLAAGQAIETDTANAVAPVKARAISQSLEADTTSVIAPAKARAIGQAVEVDTAGSVVISATIPLATEIDTSGAIVPAKAGAIGRTDESDTAGAVTAAKARSFDQATESGTASEIAVKKTTVFRLVHPVRVDGYPLDRSHVRDHGEYRYPTALTIYGSGSVLQFSETPSNAVLSAAQYVWFGGYDNQTTDLAIRALWLLNGFEVENVS